MTMTDTPAHVPTEDDTLTTGPDDGFNPAAFEARVMAGKYDGHESEMCQALIDHSMKANTRRWVIVWDGVEVTEDDYTLEACSHAQKYTGIVWGAIVLTAGRFGVHWDADITKGLVYGMLRTTLGMGDEEARAAVGELTAIGAASVLVYRDGDERPKAVSGQ